MIGFVGLSHLGIVSSIAAASKTTEGVLAYDPDAALCEQLKNCNLPIFEPGLTELLKKAGSRIEFGSDVSRLRKCRLIYFSPDTATDSENRGDFSTLERLFENALGYISENAALVVLSQVPPGVTRSFLEKLKKAPVFRSQKIFHQVETLVFGSAVERALGPERFIIGCENPERALDESYETFLKLFGCEIFKMKYESAELAKMSINVCLAATLSAANALAELCEKIGADWREIAPVLRTDKRIGPDAYLKAGLGIAGGNIERDLAAIQALSTDWGTDGAVVEAFLRSSAYRKNWALRTLHEAAGAMDSKTVIALWGLAYKQDTKSTKNSPALELIKNLAAFSFRAYDPKAILDPKMFPNAKQAPSALEACRGAKALLVMTPWKEFSSVPLARVREELTGDIILDPWGVLDETHCASLKLRHFRLGVKK